MFDALVLHGAQGLDVGHAGQAARGDDGNAHRLREFDGGLDVDAAEHAVAANVGVDDGFHAPIFKALGGGDDILAGELAPAVDGHFAILGIQATMM